jgi:hypothetical protein
MSGLIQAMSVWRTARYVLVHANDKSRHDQTHGVKTRETSVKDKEEKVLMIANAHAVVHPRTVVVHFDNAAVADTV